MRDVPTHDALYRLSERYCASAVANDEVAALMSRHHRELSALVTDDLTAEVYQVTYCRMTIRYHGGNFIKCFKHVFWSTMRDYIHRINDYKARIDAIPTQAQAEYSASDTL
jgi:hypothetical protein